MSLFADAWLKIEPTVKDYQTLIGAGGALAAAWIAARPVWKQLARMEVQTNAMLRDVLATRLQEAEVNQQRLGEPIIKFLSSAEADLGWQLELGNEHIDPEWAFNQTQRLSQARVSFHRHAFSHLDTLAIEYAKREVISASEALETALDAVHRPASTDRGDPDYSFTDEQWAALEADAKKAEDEIPRLFAKLRAAVETLAGEQLAEIQRLRQRLRDLDAALTGAPAARFRSKFR